MVIVTSGVNYKGDPYEFYIDGYWKRELDSAKDRVINKQWDFVMIVAGIPGAGKSNFSMNTARYLWPGFGKDHLAWDADSFIRITNKADEYSSVVLDESFDSFGKGVSRSKDFFRIVNHLQIIRQKHLFIILNLPDFFDLQKSIAIFRSSFLCFVYSDDDGSRGRFAVFDRDRKTRLYIDGSKYLNYNAVKANFFGRFTKQKFITEDDYEFLKKKHLESFNSKTSSGTPVNTLASNSRDLFINHLRWDLEYTIANIAKIGNCSTSIVSEVSKFNNPKFKKNQS